MVSNLDERNPDFWLAGPCNTPPNVCAATYFKDPADEDSENNHNFTKGDGF